MQMIKLLIAKHTLLVTRRLRCSPPFAALSGRASNCAGIFGNSTATNIPFSPHRTPSYIASNFDTDLSRWLTNAVSKHRILRLAAPGHSAYLTPPDDTLDRK